MNGKKYKGSTSGHHVAQKRFRTPKPCDLCNSKESPTRHHKDGNPENNKAANIQWLCRPCHGRLSAIEQWKHLNKKRTCVICGKGYEYKRKSHKTCSALCGFKLMVKVRKERHGK